MISKVFGNLKILDNILLCVLNPKTNVTNDIPNVVFYHDYSMRKVQAVTVVTSLDAAVTREALSLTDLSDLSLHPPTTNTALPIKPQNT